MKPENAVTPGTLQGPVICRTPPSVFDVYWYRRSEAPEDTPWEMERRVNFCVPLSEDRETTFELVAPPIDSGKRLVFEHMSLHCDGDSAMMVELRSGERTIRWFSVRGAGAPIELVQEAAAQIVPVPGEVFAVVYPKGPSTTHAVVALFYKIVAANRPAGGGDEAASPPPDLHRAQTQASAALEAATKPPAAGKTKGKNINLRMLEMLNGDASRIEWTAAQWAGALKCSPSTVVVTRAWATIKNARSLSAVEKIRRGDEEGADRRRHRPKRRRG